MNVLPAKLPFSAFVLLAILADAGWCQHSSLDEHQEGFGGTGCGETAIPMKDWGGRPAVEVFLGSEGPFLFHIDTGTPFAALIDAPLVERLGLETDSRLADLEDAPAGTVEHIRVGDSSFRNAPMAAYDFDAFAGPGNGPDGILGLPLFEDCLLTFDFPEREVRINSGELSSNGSDVVAYQLDPAHQTHITLPIDLAGEEILVHLDTGSPGEIMLLNRHAELLALNGEPALVGTARTPSGSAEIRQAGLIGNAGLGRYRIANPQIRFADLGPMLDSDVGNIGSGLLGALEVTIDQRNRLVQFRETGAPSGAGGQGVVRRESAGRYRVGVMFRPSPDALLVHGVVPGQAGEAAGLEAGDRVVAINGVALSELEQNDLAGIFGSPEPVALSVDRAGELLEIELVPREQ